MARSQAPGETTTSGTDRRALSQASLLIDSIETLALRVPLARTFKGSAYSMRNRCTIVTRLRTREGVVSEVYNGDTDIEQSTIVQIIHDELAPRLIGKSASDPEGCWSAMEPATNDILRDRGLALQAIACIDSAIWDVFGKFLGLPLYRLWGACRSDLPISVIGGYYHVVNGDLAELAARYQEMGFAGCKFKIGGLAPKDDAERTRLIREAAGSDFALMVDANQGYTREEAVDYGRRVGGLNLRWFEEPCRWTNDRRWMRDVRMQTGIPVAAGQSEMTLAGIRDLMVDAAIDVSNFDASWCGGPTIWRKAAGMAAAFGIAIGHHEEPQVAAHLLASTPGSTFVECFDEERDPFFWRLTRQRDQIADGHYALPDGAGFGIELDEDYVNRYVVDRRTTR